MVKTRTVHAFEGHTLREDGFISNLALQCLGGIHGRVGVRVRDRVRVRIRDAVCVAVALQCLDGIYNSVNR
jgi:hypothetical protein